MEVKFIMEDKLIDFSYKKEIENTQVKVDTKVDIENLQKILSISGEAIITNKEILTGEVKFYGEVCYEIVYINDENQIKAKRHLKEFEGKLQSDSINTFTDPVLCAIVLDTKAEQIGDNSINIDSIVQIDAYILVTDSFKEFNDSKCITKTYPIELTSVVKSGETRINITEDFNLKDKPIEILNVKCHLVPKSYQAGTGYIQLDAYLVAEIAYVIERDEKTEVRCEILRQDIKEEIEIDNIAKTNKIILNTDIKNCSIESKFENRQVTLDIPVDVRYIVFEKKQTDITVDAFSSKYETNLTYESITQITKIESYSSTERIDGEVETDESEARINRILCSDGNKVVVTKILTENKIVKIDGISYENIVYQLDDDNGTITSLNAEIPFSIQIEVPFVEENDLVTVKCEVVDFTNKLKKGRTIEIDNELGIYLLVIGQKYDSVVKEVEYGEEIIQNNSNFMLYFAKKGDTIWNVCKKLRIEEEKILMQNKGLTFPLQKDETIVIYKKAENTL